MVAGPTMDLGPVRVIVKQAGEAVLRVYGREFAVDSKADDSPVTEADLAAHRVIADGLRAAWPSIPVLSEESSVLAGHERRRTWRRCWLVDPLDGTKEFVSRNGQFTVNVALIERGRPAAGVVYAPVWDWLYWGGPGRGAFKSCGGGPPDEIRCRPEPSAGRIRVVRSRSHLNAETARVLRRLEQRFDEVSQIAMGSSLKICLIAEGRADLYPRLGPTMEWDTAAAHAVLAGAGGRLEACPGRCELAYNKADLRNPWFVARGAAA